MPDAQDLSRALCDPVSRSSRRATRAGCRNGFDATGFRSGYGKLAGAPRLICSRPPLPRAARFVALTGAALLALPQPAWASPSRFSFSWRVPL